MTRVPVKVCGLTEPATLAAAIDAGASAVGFVFAESVRRVTVAQAVELSRGVPVGVMRVGVFKDVGPGELAEAAGTGALTHVQADWMDEAVVREHAPELAFIPVYRDVPTLRVELGEEITREPRLILIESAVSGVGMLPDWGRINRAAALLTDRPFMLAGGLKPENVRDAILTTGASFVDVSSGVERAPGVKDGALINRFISEVRAGFALSGASSSRMSNTSTRANP